MTVIFAWVGWVFLLVGGIALAAISAFYTIFDNGMSGVRRAHPLCWLLVITGLALFALCIRNIPFSS